MDRRAPPARPARLLARQMLALALLAVPAGRTAAQAPTGSLTVFNAGSLAAPFRELLQAFVRRTPGVVPRQENAGSLETARKLTELGRIPDVVGVADYLVIPNLLVPGQATWYVSFARNSMVLVHSDRSIGAREISSANWWQILLRPGVRTGRSDPSLDPNGYRALMVTQLAERHYGQPGLAGRLVAAMPPRYVRPKEADLIALVQAGELDYAWSYRSIARTVGLPYVSLPPEVDLSDPDRAAWYALARVRVPGGTRAGADSITIGGEPIVYALTIPTRAPNPVAAEAFVRVVFSPDGQGILARHGFQLLDHPVAGGPGHPPAGILPAP
ncbi:MAG: extracellular solute-binding protein family 1 [Gemmatimonadetes bacterium]|nr:extracellular solute-binding protein family 1 [Gemmatimonadota bacterium]